jgi:hypothetical protein
MRSCLLAHSEGVAHWVLVCLVILLHCLSYELMNGLCRMRLEEWGTMWRKPNYTYYGGFYPIWPKKIVIAWRQVFFESSFSSEASNNKTGNRDIRYRRCEICSKSVSNIKICTWDFRRQGKKKCSKIPACLGRTLRETIISREQQNRMHQYWCVRIINFSDYCTTDENSNYQF